MHDGCLLTRLGFVRFNIKIVMNVVYRRKILLNSYDIV